MRKINNICKIIYYENYLNYIYSHFNQSIVTIIILLLKE